VSTYLQRIAALDDRLHAFIDVCDSALDAARAMIAAPRRRTRGMGCRSRQDLSASAVR
jgi:hypothetical protein